MGHVRGETEISIEVKVATNPIHAAISLPPAPPETMKLVVRTVRLDAEYVGRVTIIRHNEYLPTALTIPLRSRPSALKETAYITSLEPISLD